MINYLGALLGLALLCVCRYVITKKNSLLNEMINHISSVRAAHVEASHCFGEFW